MVETNDSKNSRSINQSEIAFVNPEWPAPKNVRAFSTTRQGGFSRSPYDGFNLALHVGDSKNNVQKNRDLLKDKLGLPSQPQWLEQTHSDVVVSVSAEQRVDLPMIQADASYTNQKGVVCTVMTADCLPVLICNSAGSWIAAVHAGWKGLASGIIENTIVNYTGDSSDLMAWIGPAISAARFEVGEDVRESFVANNKQLACYFKVNQHNKFQCDLNGIAKTILESNSIESYGGNYCSFKDKDKFYSYRRENETGRMASIIWMESTAGNRMANTEETDMHSTSQKDSKGVLF